MPALVAGIQILDSESIKDVDGIGPRACPRSALLRDASRINSTCVDKPGHDAGNASLSTHLVLVQFRDRVVKRSFHRLVLVLTLVLNIQLLTIEVEYKYANG
jgi:hypothetical protein